MLNYNGNNINQLEALLVSLKHNKDSRRHIISLWNPIQLNEMAISFGAGIPIRRTFQEVNTDEGRIFKYLALLNLGFEIGQRGTLDNNFIKEKFISARIGITINDKWFIRRKID